MNVDPANANNLIVQATDNVALTLGLVGKYSPIANGDALTFTPTLTGAAVLAVVQCGDPDVLRHAAGR